ncbi:sigma-70 family RNA polymerase sigma factor [Candidatus Gracilibacteria bacterium]|nr:sigma-70 family RNA polymerase sigma factor [Candidatus Gracilibacteria bacterium]
MLGLYLYTWQAEDNRALNGALRQGEELAILRDDALLALVVQRHEAALGVIYDRYGALVYSIALRVTGDRLTAEEVVQDVFQNVWQAAGGYQPQRAAFSSWLIGIARHRAIDAMRSKRERARVREQTAVDETYLDGGSGPEAAADQSALRDAVRSALANLPQSQRQAIELAYYGDLTRAEIAERLGEPLGTVKTRLRLGLNKLRDLLRPFDESA